MIDVLNRMVWLILVRTGLLLQQTWSNYLQNVNVGLYQENIV